MLLHADGLVPPLHIPSTVNPTAASSPSRESFSLPVHVSSSASAAAMPISDFSSAFVLRIPRGSQLLQPLSQSVLAELAHDQQQPALKHASSSTAFGRGSMHHQEGVEPVCGGDGGEERPPGRKGGKRRRKSKRVSDPAMAHVEEHLRILKHVRVKRASPRFVPALIYTQTCIASDLFRAFQNGLSPALLITATAQCEL